MEKVKSGSRSAWTTTKNGASWAWNGIKTGARKTKEKFERHPKSIDQSYGKHLLRSWRAGAYAAWVSFQYMVHGCFPFFFERHCDLDENQGLNRNDVPLSEMESDYVDYDIEESSLDSDDEAPLTRN